MPSECGQDRASETKTKETSPAVVHETETLGNKGGGPRTRESVEELEIGVKVQTFPVTGAPADSSAPAPSVFGPSGTATTEIRKEDDE